MKGLMLLGAFCVPLVLGAQDKPKSVALPRPSAAPTTAPVVADAAMKGDIETVRKLIKQGAPVSTAQGDGMTALHWAAERGDVAMATELLAAHANVKSTTRLGDYTPLHIAARNGNSAIVVALLKAGADPKASTMSGSTPLHLAAASGSAESITALLEHGADANAREAAWGQTPLVFAAEYDRPAAITALLKHGADPSIHTNMISLQDEAAKEQAATKKRNEVLISFEPEKHKDDTVKKVVDTLGGTGGAGAQAFGAGAGSGFGRGPKGPMPKGPFTPDQIQQAINAGREVMLAPIVPKGPVTEVVDTLNGGVAGFANTVGGMGGMTALHHAAREGNVAAVKALLDGGANINDTSYVDHTTPLLLAAINGQYDTEMELIKRGANPNLASHPNMTPLYATINAEWAPKSRFPQPQALQVQKTSYLDVMEALLKAKADPNVRLTQQPWYFAFNNCGNANCGLENIEGTDAFWRAAYALDVPAMKLLVKYGADYNVPSQRTVVAGGGRGGRGGGGARGGGRGGAGAAADTSAGGAPAAAAAAGRGRGGAAAGPPPPPAIDSLAKIAPVGLGVYPIHAATGVGYGTGFAGNSHNHAPDGWMPALKYLVEELHADVNARDAQGFTPMHNAAARGDNDMILWLVAHGGDVKAVTKTGKTTVDMANGPQSRVSPIPETIALLEKLGAVNTHRCVSC